MSEAIITVENLGKKYRISHQGDRPRYTALRDVIAQKASGFFQTLKFGKQKAEMGKAEGPNKFQLSQSQLSTLARSEDFWALKDVSFEVKRGEVVGIIGRNGAGKSTLLKILSRITEPTTGEVCLRGRVASLLEVGTGFHPELTGRENIFLNGAILGMQRAEIKRKFDEIVAFAEVEKFLDTPVKRYSSGMYVRLAFAVAAHLEPEILIVDEVLAVGDMEFQKKCLGKMKDVATGGRTVLFVSHNLKAIEQLCERTIYIKSGSVCSDGKPSEIIALYMQATEPLTGAAVRTELLPGLFLNRLHFEPSECLSKSAVSFVLEISAASPQTLSSLELLFFNKQSERVSLIDLRTPNLKYTLRNGEKLTIDGSIASLNLVEGDYLIGLCIRSNDLWRDHLNLLRVRLLPPPIPQGLTPVDSQWLGVVAFDHRLKVRID